MSDEFSSGELIPLDGPHVVLASGGPLMRLECVEGDNALCSWSEWSGDWRNGNGVETVHRRMFGIATLRVLCKATKEELEAMVDAHRP